MNEEIQDQELNVETRAKQMGWTPEEEFRGDPDKWLDAESFVKRAETELPIALGTIKTLARKLERMETRFNQVSNTLEKFSEYHKTALDRETAKAATEYQRGLEEAQAKMRQAAEEGDLEGFDAAKAKSDALIKDAAALEDKPKAESDGGKPKPDPEINRQWVEENPWFVKNVKMYSYAMQCGDFLGRTKPELGQKEQLEEIAKMVKEEFPDHFTNPARKKAAAVGTGDDTASPGGGRNKKTVNDLPAIAREMLEGFKRDIKGYTDEQFMARYDGPWKS